MSLSIPEFWKLVIESRLLTPEQCQLLGTEYGRVDGAAAQGNVKSLAEWLISRNALTVYQSAILQAGRSGPFHYGDYKVYDRIDECPLKESFRAIHEPTSHPVLLKFVGGEAGQGGQKWLELAYRIQVQCSIVHPNLNRCFEAVDLTTFKFVAFEDSQGQSVAQRVGGKKLRPNDACRIIRQVALGLAAMHHSGLIHGDIQPSNLWLESSGNVRLLRDALFEPLPIHLSQSDDASQLLARADYLAPELAQHGKAPDVLSDIYALGCSLYQLLTGHPPFEDGDISQKLTRHASEAIQPLEQFGVPAEVGQLVAYMMAKNPGVRYQQASVVAEQIAPFVDAKQLNIQPPAPPQTLPAYESWVAQKQAALATQTPEPQPAATFPGFDSSEGGGVAVATAPAAATEVSPINVAAEPATKPSLDSNAIAERYKKQKLKKQIITASVSAVTVLAIAITAYVFFSKPDGETPNPNGGGDVAQTNGNEGSGTGGSTNKNNEGENSSTPDTYGTFVKVQEIPDDGNALWAPPTTGPPISFEYVPLRAGILIAVRPAEMIQSGEGNRVLQALGPKFSAAKQTWEQASGCPLGEVEHMLVGFHENEGNSLRSSYVVRLVKSTTVDDLVKRWGSPSTKPLSDAERKVDTSIYVASNGWAYFVPSNQESDVKLFVMGAESDIEECAKKGKAPPVSSKDVEFLRRTSDVERHFSLIFSPKQLLNDEGQKLFAGEYEKLNALFKRHLDDPDLMAVMVSAHFGEQSYLEIRLKTNVGKNPFELAEEWRDQFTNLPDDVRNYVVRLGSNPYWESLRINYPQMMFQMQKHMRVGVEDNQAIINTWMPGSAPHNLVAGTELVIASTPGQVYTPTTTVTTKPTPKTLEELLATNYEIDIPTDDMVNIMAAIMDDMRDSYPKLPFEFEIKILGNHLELAGITKNQRVSIKKSAPFSEVLTEIVRKANPVQGAELFADDQKLLWVVGPHPDSGKKIILITTRKSAAVEKYSLPEPFRPKAS